MMHSPKNQYRFVPAQSPKRLLFQLRIYVTQLERSHIIMTVNLSRFNCILRARQINPSHTKISTYLNITLYILPITTLSYIYVQFVVALKRATTIRRFLTPFRFFRTLHQGLTFHKLPVYGIYGNNYPDFINNFFVKRLYLQTQVVKKQYYLSCSFENLVQLDTSLKIPEINNTFNNNSHTFFAQLSTTSMSSWQNEYKSIVMRFKYKFWNEVQYCYFTKLINIENIKESCFFVMIQHIFNNP